MTTEIVLMNSAAVALAADSAVTVAGTKVYNTANKVFTLSKYAPVGVMIYNSASIMNVPWETLIKDYRKKLGKKKFSKLNEYYEDFLYYLGNNNLFFTSDLKEFYLKDCVLSVLQDLVTEALQGEKQVDNKDFMDVVKKYTDIFSTRPLLGGFLENDQTLLNDSIKEIILENNQFLECILDKTEEVIPSTAFLIAILLTTWLNPMNLTGVVIVGFGEDEAFPTLVSCTVDGIISDKLRCALYTTASIGYDNPAEIIPFAQTQMIDSVMLGASRTYTNNLLSVVETILGGVPELIINSIKELSDVQKNDYKQLHASLTQRLISDFHKEWGYSNTAPMLEDKFNAVAVLPKAELAIAAETFIHVAQLEHRLSLHAETVGGPVDVAVITKGDGLVWIKRKHYFDPNLNLGFIENYYNKDYIPQTSTEA